MEKPKTENLTAWITGRNLNIYQKADAVIEHNKLLEYVSDLENQSTSQKEVIAELEENIDVLEKQLWEVSEERNSQKETIDRFREFVNWALNQDDYGSISGRAQFMGKAKQLLK